MRFAETDAMGIVHHSRYVPYLEEARVEYLRAIGRPYTAWREAGIDSAVLECWVQYRQPLRFDDEVDVHVALVTATRTTFEMAYLLTVGDVVSARAVTVHGCVTAAGRPTRLPAWLPALACRRPGVTAAGARARRAKLRRRDGVQCRRSSPATRCDRAMTVGASHGPEMTRRLQDARELTGGSRRRRR